MRAVHSFQTRNCAFPPAGLLFFPCARRIPSLHKAERIKSLSQLANLHEESAMSKYREVFDVLQSTEYAEASESLAALLEAGQTTGLRTTAGKPGGVSRSFLEEVGLDGWATEDRYQNGFYSLAG